ncbi:hypothetical protein A9Q02_18290 [Candidatus Chloroploca asiatica]|uniref:Uncharacterized protein n=1 Tax=Candidatus Chloroploca asiatica TaxID=1506545 RepID=A0A2H3KHZ8_9CHLR|nr:hypothetical protein A9Q02_18290 [Candidatus Chloroploca asiatica]
MNQNLTEAAKPLEWGRVKGCRGKMRSGREDAARGPRIVGKKGVEVDQTHRRGLLNLGHTDLLAMVT